jgi:hypothetical protein
MGFEFGLQDNQFIRPALGAGPTKGWSGRFCRALSRLKRIKNARDLSQTESPTKGAARSTVLHTPV